MNIQPIETRYAGCRFRSRLEARWAVFFDTLGITWEYEPQGYTVGPEKRPYLPDFRLPELNAFVEVKGDLDRLDLNLLANLAGRVHDTPFVILLGQVPDLKDGFPPMHMVLMPATEARQGDRDWPTTNQALAAISGLPVEGQAAVRALLRYDGRLAIVVQRFVFVPTATNPAGMLHVFAPGAVGSAAELLEPGTCWPVLFMPKAKAAYEAARSARFEHGESGA